jgi:hypothetical protein
MRTAAHPLRAGLTPYVMQRVGRFYLAPLFSSGLSDSCAPIDLADFATARSRYARDHAFVHKSVTRAGVTT